MAKAQAHLGVLQAGAGNSGLYRAAIRQALTLGAVALLLVLLRDRIVHIDTSEVIHAFGQVSLAQWIGALAATAASFWALGQYDAVVHRHLATGVPCFRARRAGIAAIAISQTLGLGLLTGSLVRWRLLPGQSLAQATRVTAAVAVSFLMGWAVLTAAAVLILPGAGGAMWLGSLAVLAAGAGLVVLSLIAPQIRLGRLALRVPSLLTMSRILMLAALDTGAAALALWILMPTGTSLEFSLLLPAYLLALGAGILGNTPGGMGPFELTLIGFLPAMAPEPLLAAVLAYRAVYFALPACLGMIAMAVGPRAHEAAAGRARPLSLQGLLAGNDTPAHPMALAVQASARAEAGLLHQGEHRILICGGGTAGWMTGSTQQALVAISEPFGLRGATQDLIGRLANEASFRGLSPCLYKVSARSAAIARRAGWRALPVAREAWVAPAQFSLATPDRAGLRRKLRKAESAGVVIEGPGDAPLPFAEMARIAAEWAEARGGERGFSMGRFAPDYVAGQKVWLAYHHGQLVAFAGFHHSRSEWALDLMRQCATAPDGTMHALIAAALTQAQRENLPRLALAALPPDRQAAKTPLARFLARAEATLGLNGLSQFKEAFAPNWERLYIAAPSLAALAIAAFDIARTIRNPGPLPLAGGACLPEITPRLQHASSRL